MHPPLARRQLLRAGLAAGAMLALPSARACEFFARNLRITHPWTRASAPGATSAVVCMRFDEVTLSDRLIGVESPVAESAEMGGLTMGGLTMGGVPVPGPVNLAIPADQLLTLTEAGPHIRLIGLRHELAVGREYPLTLVFERSGSVQTSLSVDYARFA